MTGLIILGPSDFVIYINDLPEHVKSQIDVFICRQHKADEKGVLPQNDMRVYKTGPTVGF